MTTNNHPAHCPVSLERLSLNDAIAHADERADALSGPCAAQHAQLAAWLRELQERRKADAVKVIDGAIAAFGAEPVAWRYRYVHTPKTEEHGYPFTTEWKLCDSEDECNPSDCFERQPLYTAQPAPVVNAIDETLIEALRLVQCMLDDYLERNYGHAQEWIRHISAKMEDYSEQHGDDAYSVISAAMLQAGNSPVTPDKSTCKYCGGTGYFRWQQSYELMPCPCNGCTEFAAPQQEDL